MQASSFSRQPLSEVSVFTKFVFINRVFTLQRLFRGFTLVILLAAASLTIAQDEDPGHTMRPVIRGRHAAVSSMKPQATDAARQILQAGGNAFDAAVAGQAALGVTDFPMNGVGSDAVLLVYKAAEKKVYSV